MDNKKENDIDINLIKKYIYKNQQADNEEQKLFAALYSYYKKLSKLNFKSDNRYLFRGLEEEIFYNKTYEFTDEEKIRIEIDRIKKIKISCPKTEQKVKKIIEEIETLLEDKLIISKSVIKYIKKKIIEIQILLNINITFYSEVYDLFLDKYCDISIEEYAKRKKRE